MSSEPPVVAEFGRALGALGWVTDLLVGGSLATGDHTAGVSDLDLVAVVDGPVDERRVAALKRLHQTVDAGTGKGLKLGCVYVNGSQLGDAAARHPTWTHGRLVRRRLSGVSRAELVRYGYAVFGRAPSDLLAVVSADDVRRAAQAELLGYWAYATRHPLLWLDPTFIDLALTSMARGRHAMVTGELLTKSAAIEQADGPEWLTEQIRARRLGRVVVSPRLRAGVIAWRDTRRTVADARSMRIAGT